MVDVAVLSELARALLRTTLSCRVGAEAVTSRRRHVSEGEATALEWAEMQDWLEAQLADHRAHLAALQAQARAGDRMQLDTQETQVEALKEELFVKLAQVFVQRRLASKIEQQSTVWRFAFATEASADRDRRGAQMLRLRDSLVEQVLQERTALAQLSERVQAVRTENQQLREGNRQMMSQIQQQKEAAVPAAMPTEQTLRLQREIATRQSRVDILRNVFQRLILESGVAWTEDPALFELMLRLEA